MADLSFREPEVRNFLIVQLAFIETGKSLKEFTENVLKRLHMKIYKRLAGHPECTERCSQTYGHRSTRWCCTCSAWKKQLSLSVKHEWTKQSIKWKRMESWKWSEDFSTFLQIYLPSNWSAGLIDIKDMSTMLSIWDNCDAFDIDKVIIDKLKKYRNRFYAHNSEGKVGEGNTRKVFTWLKRLLSQKELENNVPNVKGIHDRLCELERQDEVKSSAEINDSLKKLWQQTHQIERKVNVTNERVEQMNRRQTGDYKTLTTMPSKFFQLFKQNRAIIIMLLLLSAFAVILRKDSLTEGCVSELYSVPWKTDITLSDYVRGHGKLIGREWMFKEIGETLLLRNTTSRGIVLLAEMGYGKSAIASHLVCADKYSVGWHLRQRIIAFHVCRFDALVTRTPDVFIRRLVGMTSARIPEYGSSVAMTIDHGEWFYDSERCRSDPIGCIQNLFVYRLKDISYNPEKPWIILIDALDECKDETREINEILSLIKSISLDLPPWLRFLITTRNTTVVNTVKEFETISLFSNDPRNVQDIQSYISQAGIDMKYISNISEYVIGKSPNFLFAINALQYWQDTNHSFAEIPLTLERIYERNFERIYGANEEKFSHSKVLFEILCASLESLTEKVLLDVFRFHRQNIELNFFHKEVRVLSHFVKRNGDFITFTHVSLYNWLVSKDRYGQPFFIDTEKGHEIWARYLMHAIYKDSPVDLIDLVEHVSLSNTTQLTQNMHKLQIWNETAHTQYILHRLASRVDSYKCACLILKHTGNVDERNDWNATASFIAAMNGHRQTLLALLENGASLTVQLNDFPTVTRPGTVFLCKNTIFCKFGLLDIASHQGHKNVVELIVSRNSSLASRLNGVSLKPVHLACENGHLDVLNTFVKLDPHLADRTCLHHAAANGHTHIVKHILQLGIKDSCPICNDSAYWVDANKTRMFGSTNESEVTDFIYFQEPSEHIVLHDDWWRIMCETALHAAIRGKHADTVKILSLRGNGNLKCRDRNGYTPFLLAVKMNAVDMLPISVLKTFLNDTCKPLDTANATFLNMHEKLYFQSSNCRAGSAVAHLISQYNFINVVEYLKQNDIEIDWNQEDFAKWRPIQTAIFYNNVEILKNISNQRLDQIQTKNDSSILHFATRFGSKKVLKVLRSFSNLSVMHVLDRYNRSLLFYALLRPLPLYSSEMSERTVLKLVKYLITNYDQNVLHTDSFGKNILHYVLANGHYNVLEYLHTKFPKLMSHLFAKTDKMGQTPLDKGLHMLKSVEEYFIPCSVDKMFTDSCDTQTLSPYLTPQERGIVLSLQLFESDMKRRGLKFEYLVHATRKNSFFLTVHFLKHVNWRVTIQNNPLLAEIEGKSINEMVFLAWLVWMPREFIYCGVPEARSPAHYLLSRSYLMNFQLLTPYLIVKQLSFSFEVSELNNCTDTQNFTVLHRAIQGGNYEAVELLYKNGMRFTSKWMSMENVLWIPLVNMHIPPFGSDVQDRSPLLDNTTSVERMSHIRNELQQSLERILMFVINKQHKKIKKSYLCRQGEKSFSLVHLIAANGMLRALKRIKLYWGKGVLHCPNFHNISPSHLADLFDKNETSDYLRTVVGPSEDVGVYANGNLHYKFLTDFYDLDNTPLACLGKVKSRMTFYQKMQAVRCLKEYSGAGKPQFISALIIADSNEKNIHFIHRTCAALVSHECYRIRTNAYTNKRNIKRLVLTFAKLIIANVKITIILESLMNDKIILATPRMSKYIQASGQYLVKYMRFQYMNVLKSSLSYTAISTNSKSLVAHIDEIKHRHVLDLIKRLREHSKVMDDYIQTVSRLKNSHN